MSINRTPANWTAGEFPTASKMQAEVKGLWDGLQADWDSWTPIWSSTGTQPSLGNGTLLGQYMQHGSTVVAWWLRLIPGSTTTYGTGAWRFTPPGPGIARTSHLIEMLDQSASTVTTGRAMLLGSVISVYNVTGSNDSSIAGTTPFTWASGDQLLITGAGYRLGS